MLTTSIFYHSYYNSEIDDIFPRLSHIASGDKKLFLNINPDQNKEINCNKINSIIISTPNIGKDIGAKLALMDLYLKTNQKSDLILLLHDKQSPQVFYGEKWKNDLYKIAEKENTQNILELFKNQPDVGIICATDCISDEYDAEKDEFKTTNNLILKDYIKRFNFRLTDYSFVAGNMFWVRSCIYEEFFKKYNPLELRSELEKGNVLDNEVGTKTHSLERVFSWIATSQGYKIFGI